MDRHEFFHDFQFENHKIINEQVYAISRVEFDTLINHRQSNLSSDG